MWHEKEDPSIFLLCVSLKAAIDASSSLASSTDVEHLQAVLLHPGPFHLETEELFSTNQGVGVRLASSAKTQWTDTCDLPFWILDLRGITLWGLTGWMSRIMPRTTPINKLLVGSFSGVEISRIMFKISTIHDLGFWWGSLYGFEWEG